VQHQSEITKDLIRLPSVWLRRMLTGIVSQLETAPPIELKAALQARERLRLLKSLPQAVPTIEDLARRVELAELLEPLRVLIGAEGGWDGTPRRDRFVGRKNELPSCVPLWMNSRHKAYWKQPPASHLMRG